LKQRFEALRREHEAEAAGTARKSLADPNAYDLAALNEPQRKALIRFWEAWQEAVLRCFQWNRFSHSGSSEGSAPALALGRLGDPSEPSLAPQRVEPPAPGSSTPAPIPPNLHQTFSGASG
jgi:hypothetical protein